MDVSNLSAADALKMFDEQETPKADPAPAEATPEPAKETPAEPAATAEPAAKPEANEPEKNDEPEGIATRDGKHVIPYSVLQSERTRAANAERELQAVNARIAELEARLSGQNPTANNGEPADTTTTDKEAAERFAALEEDFPTVAAELKTMRDLVKSLTSQIKETAQTTQAIEDERKSQTALSVQEAIDSVPKMAHIQATDPEAFQLAITFDATLKERPDWQGKPMAERFAKVIELVEAAQGVIEVPGQKKPTAQTQEGLKDAVQQKLAKAAPAVPTSLSQFPAGMPAATDEAGAVEAMTYAQLQAKFAGMGPDQLDAYLSKL